MLLHLYNAKCDSYAVKCYITSNPKLPNIATLLEPTVYSISWFKDSMVCSVCTCVLLYPIIIFSDAIFGNSGGLLPE